MLVRKLGHSCVVVESAGVRVLIDPGTYSHGFEEVGGLAAILVTHQHPDHLDVDRLPAVLERNRSAQVYADAGSAAVLAERDIKAATVDGGDRIDAAGLEVAVVGHEHAVIHPDIPVIPNVCYLVGGRFFHPGDSFTRPDHEVEVLGLPTAAPWMKAAEAVDYLRAVSPRVAVPLHDAMLARPQMTYGLFDQLAPAGTQVRILDGGETLEI